MFRVYLGFLSVDAYKTWFWNGVEFGARVWFQCRKKRRREVMAPVVRSFPGVDDELRRILEANMDEAPARRRARESFKEIQLGIDHMLFKVLLFNFFLFSVALVYCMDESNFVNYVCYLSIC